MAKRQRNVSLPSHKKYIKEIRKNGGYTVNPPLNNNPIMCTWKWTASGWHCNFTTKTLHCSLTILNTSHKGMPSLVLQASYMKWILFSDWLPTSFQQEQFFFWPCHKSFFPGKGCLFNFTGVSIILFCLFWNWPISNHHLDLNMLGL